MRMPFSSSAERVVFVVVVAVGLMPCRVAARPVTRAKSDVQMQILDDTEHTEPDVHTIEIVPQTIQITDDGDPSVTVQVNKIENGGTVATDDLIATPPFVTLQSWNADFEPLIYFPPVQEVVVCEGTQYNSSSGKMTINLSEFNAGLTNKSGLLKKLACHQKAQERLLVVHQSCPTANVDVWTQSQFLPTALDKQIVNVSCPNMPAAGVQAVVYQSGPAELTMEVLDSVDMNVETSSVISQQAIDDFVQAFNNFLLAIVGLFDIDAPNLTATGNQTVEAIDGDGAPVFFAASSRDVNGILTGEPVDPAPMVECRDQTNAVRASGSLFGIGQWTVTCRSWDHKWDLLQNKFVLGNQAVPKSFTVTIVAKQSPVQEGCINALNKDAAKVGQAQGKQNAACARLGRKGAVAADCPSADLKQKVAKKVAKAEADDADKCMPPPDFAYTSGGAASAAYQQAELALLADVFGGTDLSATISTDKTIGGCQAATIKDVERISSAAAKAFVKCKKGLLKGVAVSVTSLAGCVGDDAALVAKAATKLTADVAGKCDGVAVGTAFPGSCSGAAPDTLAACLAARARCRMCLAANAADALSAPCDNIDDGAPNGSCTP